MTNEVLIDTTRGSLKSHNSFGFCYVSWSFTVTKKMQTYVSKRGDKSARCGVD